MRAWTAFKAGLFGAMTLTMIFHWKVEEAKAEPVAIVATDGKAVPSENIFYAERIPDGHWEPTGTHRITFYCPCRRCNGKNAGRTASGAEMTAGRTVAASSKEFPFGTKLLINGEIYTVEDRGVGVGHIDILVNSHHEALDKGVKRLEVFRWTE